MAENCFFGELFGWSSQIRSRLLRVIEMQLTELYFFGVVDREAEDVYPKKTEYELTAFGKSLLPILSKIESWGQEHATYVKEKQHELEHTGGGCLIMLQLKFATFATAYL